MTRVADSTIKGFLYQFNKTAKVILEKQNNETIIVEGIIEDIDVISSKNEDDIIEATQCKYHEAKNYTLSLIYKPVLQMLHGFSNGKSADNLIIFIHVKDKQEYQAKLTEKELDECFATTNKVLQGIIQGIKIPYNKGEFLTKLTIEFGPSLEALELDVKKNLTAEFPPQFDIDGLVYPNIISTISKMAANKTDEERKTSKKTLIDNIKKTGQLVFTKWIYYTKSKDIALKTSRKIIHESLSQNHPKRYIYINPKGVSDFNEQVVNFINNFLNKYHHKPAHTSTPLFIIAEQKSVIDDIAVRLFKKEIRSITGYMGSEFFLSELLKRPLLNKSKLPQDSEFRVRLCDASKMTSILDIARPDHFYLITNSPTYSIDKLDINIYQIGVDNFSDVEFIFSLKGTTNEE